MTARRETLLTTPARAGLLVGASAAVYALALAGISGLQAEADAAVTAARAPYQEALAQTRAANDELAARILKAEAETRALTGTYGKVGVSIEAYQSRLEALAALVTEVQGSAAALPARIKLPTVTMRGAVSGSSQSGGGSTTPRTTAKTGASGG